MTRPFAGVERFFERLFERPAARLFHAQLQPIQLERRLERSMESGRVVNGGTIYVPNRYHVTLNPIDLRGFDAQRPRLEADLSDALRARARARGYRLLGRPAVVLAGSSAVDSGDIQVSAEVIDPGRANGGPGRSPRPPAPSIAPAVPSVGPPTPWHEPTPGQPTPWPAPMPTSPAPGTTPTPWHEPTPAPVPMPATAAAWAPPALAGPSAAGDAAIAWSSAPLGPVGPPPPYVSTLPVARAPVGPPPAPVAPAAATVGAPRAPGPDPAPQPASGAPPSVASQPAVPFPPAPTARPSAPATAPYAAPRYPGPMARIVVRTLAGPAGSHIFSGGAARVGRSSDNDIVLADDRVSRHHGQFTARQGMLVYTDLGSTNGSFVNGTRAREIVLGFGDIVRLGNATLTIEPTS